MAYLPEEANWEEGIRRLEKTDPAMAGLDGVMNTQAAQLGNRTVFLKGGIEGLQQLPTTLQTTDPPSYVVARIGVADGGAQQFKVSKFFSPPEKDKIE
jgi:hypothetical protein